MDLFHLYILNFSNDPGNVSFLNTIQSYVSRAFCHKFDPVVYTGKQFSFMYYGKFWSFY